MASDSDRPRSVLDWLDDRTGYRAGLHHVLGEPLPSGVGWFFTSGSILMMLLGVQLVTGVVLTMYYVPTPDHAHQSVQFITRQLTFGRVLRGLHFFGASFIVVAAVVHMLRVLLFGAYKAPREVTWFTGVTLLLIILGFGLSGYLLPWDQRAYWATVVTINIAASAPLVGEWLAAILRGGTDVGALTLSRWYSAHVILLPGALVAFVGLHLFLMRRHGIAGPVRRREGPELPFYPDHAVKDTVAGAVVFAALLTFAVVGDAPLDAVADPADATYIPRPEWYFLSLFQLLKYFPGPLEPVATIGIPGLLVLLLFLLPFLDRGPDRHPLRRPFVTGAVVVGGLTIVTLTILGLRDSPANPEESEWGLRAIAGHMVAAKPECAGCHKVGGAAADLTTLRPTRDPAWVTAHVSDPETIAPGFRPVPSEANVLEGEAVAEFVRKLRAGHREPPSMPAQDRTAAFVLATQCINCHVVGREGIEDGPELTAIGKERDADWLRRWITDPIEIEPLADMPAFGDVLTEEEMDAVVADLARRK